jgi:spore germination cell wall hydrolase CwlJ-like protein
MQHKSIVAIAAAILSSLMIFTSVAMSKTEMWQVPLSTIKYSQLSKRTQKQIDCLAKNIYYEAAFEPKEGWMAVGLVTMNRVKSGNYADDVCGVVYQKTGHTHQFSWVGLKKLSSINPTIYGDIVDLATLIYMNHDRLKDITGGATFYHADYVRPGWKLERTKQIGQHIFYKSPKDMI